MVLVVFSVGPSAEGSSTETLVRVRQQRGGSSAHKSTLNLRIKPALFRARPEPDVSQTRDSKPSTQPCRSTASTYFCENRYCPLSWLLLKPMMVMIVTNMMRRISTVIIPYPGEAEAPSGYSRSDGLLARLLKPSSFVHCVSAWRSTFAESLMLLRVSGMGIRLPYIPGLAECDGKYPCPRYHAVSPISCKRSRMADQTNCSWHENMRPDLAVWSRSCCRFFWSRYRTCARQLFFFASPAAHKWAAYGLGTLN